jgi:vitellogenic carboxypeptidase-like protein
MLYAASGNTNPNATVNDTAPLILWLQGGPGCADAGNYVEMGPFNVITGPDGLPQPVVNGITWNERYHMLFVDAPVGVGYSVCGGDLPVSAMGYAAHMEAFLINFYEVYPSLKSQDFYIFGESYAGHYIPAVTSTLILNYSHNNIRVSGNLASHFLKILGVGIGNGWTDPISHMSGYSQYVFSVGLADFKFIDYLQSIQSQFNAYVSQGNFVDATNLFNLEDSDIIDLNTTNPWINIYNYRNESEGNPNFSSCDF